MRENYDDFTSDSIIYDDYCLYVAYVINVALCARALLDLFFLNIRVKRKQPPVTKFALVGK